MKTLNDLRRVMFDTIERLMDEHNPMDIDRAKAITNVCHTLIESAKVEVDYLRATDAPASGLGFFPGEDAMPKRIGRDG